MLPCFFITNAKDTIEGRQMEVLPSQNIAGTESILYKQLEEGFMFMLARRVPEPFENLMSPTTSFQMDVSFLR
jgi:nitrate reductase beta subunit